MRPFPMPRFVGARLWKGKLPKTRQEAFSRLKDRAKNYRPSAGKEGYLEKILHDMDRADIETGFGQANPIQEQMVRKPKNLLEFLYGVDYESLGRLGDYYSQELERKGGGIRVPELPYNLMDSPKPPVLPITERDKFPRNKIKEVLNYLMENYEINPEPKEPISLSR